MTVTKDEFGLINQFAKEPAMEPVDNNYRPMIAWDVRGEQLNGRLAMLGFVIGVATEAITGQGILAQIRSIFG
jgi:hypothetical protein